MPELPEVETIVEELKDKIKGKKLRNLVISVAKMVSGSIEKVIGLKIKDVKRRAKLIIIDLEEDQHIVIHLKLTGQLLYLDKGKDKTKTGEGIGKHIRVLFNFSDSSRLVFNDLRKFGFVKILNSEDLTELLKKENYGPEPLGKDFTLEKFKEILSKRPKAKIKILLMDQTFIAGIGNLYSDEILFYAGIHPQREVSSLKTDEIKKLYEGIGIILRSALKYKGSSIDTYRRITGQKGKYELHRKVYRRKGEKCYRCSSVIKVMKIGGRSAHFCPKCQR